ncbi:MAG: tyrosine-type recombinase/integrase [Candidatus Dormibacteria bacterium]
MTTAMLGMVATDASGVSTPPPAPVAGPSPTLAGWLDHWLDDVARTRPHSHADYAQKMRKHVVPRIGSVPLAQLKAAQVTALRADLAATSLQPASQRTVLAVLKVALHAAEQQGLLGCNPLDALPRTGAKRRDVLSRRDCQRLVSTARRDENIGALVLLALTTGARQGKLLPLTWDDVDWDRGTLALRRAVRRDLRGRPTVQVQEHDEHLHVSPGVLSALRRHQASQHQRPPTGARPRRGGGLVFASRTGTLLDRSHLLDRYYALLAEAKCPRVHFRDLRHACDHFLVPDGLAATA